MKLLIAAVLCLSVVSWSEAKATEFFQKPVKPFEYFAQYAGSGRIVAGSNAQLGQFPWQAAVHMTKSDGQYFCGGALIAPNWVLTAAHCVQGVISFKIRLGVTRLDSSQSSEVIMTSTNGFHHPQYNSGNLNNDIALIKLPSSVAVNNNIKTIRLPTRSEASDTLAGQRLTVSGWGKTSDTSGIASALQYVTLNGITNSDCAKVYGSIIVSSTLCCKGDQQQQSTCNGDSGGPLTANRNGEPVHVGVVSFVSSAGCASGNPSGYVRTASFLDWIGSNTGIPIKN